MVTSKKHACHLYRPGNRWRHCDIRCCSFNTPNISHTVRTVDPLRHLLVVNKYKFVIKGYAPFTGSSVSESLVLFFTCVLGIRSHWFESFPNTELPLWPLFSLIK